MAHGGRIGGSHRKESRVTQQLYTAVPSRPDSGSVIVWSPGSFASLLDVTSPSDWFPTLGGVCARRAASKILYDGRRDRTGAGGVGTSALRVGDMNVALSIVPAGGIDGGTATWLTLGGLDGRVGFV